jgi:integrase/recombinase XerD
MSPPRRVSSIADRYDRSLQLARTRKLPPDCPRPKPTSFWPPENVALLERYRDWLLQGGASELVTDNYSIPMAGHVLGLNLKPHDQLDLERDLDCALHYIKAKKLSTAWTNNCRNALVKFRMFLHLERGLGEENTEANIDISDRAAGLPAWLVKHLEGYLNVQRRNWRPARVKANAQRFWSSHLRVWRFLCERGRVCQFRDVKRQHFMDYVNHRLDAGYAVSGINNDIRTFRSFLRYLQDQGIEVPQSLLRIPDLKAPDPLPKFLTDGQMKRLRDDFEERALNTDKFSHLRDRLLDRAAFYLLWQGGMRLGEVEELRLEDLDLSGRRLTIRNSKGLKDRVVFLTDAAVLALREYLAVRGEGYGDHVFLYRNRPVKRSLIHSRIKAAGERAGVTVYPHRLRHTCATQLLNAGCRVTSIQRFLGHKRLNTTMTYARAHDQTVADDYYTAMASVEESLDFLGHEQDESTLPLNGDERARILAFADRLTRPELGYLERLAVVKQMKRILAGEGVNGNNVEKMTSEHLSRSLHEAGSPSRV